MNPCPCGYYGDPSRPCRCSPLQIGRYASRLSGPLRDRIDLTLSVAALPARDLAGSQAGEPSAFVRARVVAARERQLARDGALNARLQGRALRARTALGREARRLFDAALTRLALTARGHDRVLRVARTIADLDRSNAVHAEHLAEALQFREF